MKIEIEDKDVKEILDLMYYVGLESWGDTARELEERVNQVTLRLAEAVNKAEESE